MRIVPIQDARSESELEPETVQAPREPTQRCQRWMCILWPAFLVAGIAEGIFFTLFDPEDLHLFGATLELSRTAIYTIGFFAFWAIGVLAAAGTLLLRETSRVE